MKSSVVRPIQNAVKGPGSIVNVPRIKYLSLDALQIIKLRG